MNTFRSHRIAKIVVYYNNIRQVITHDSFPAIIVHDQSVINFSPTAEVDTHVYYFCSFDKTVCRLLCVKSSKFFGGLFTFLIANIFSSLLG